MIITGYTVNTPYEGLARGCAWAWGQLGFKVEVVAYDSLGRWVLNNLMVPDLIARLWDGEGPVLWLDADVRPNLRKPLDEIQSYVKNLINGSGDIACEFRPNQPPWQSVSTGIVQFSGTPASRDLFHQWQANCRAAIERFDAVTDMAIIKGADQGVLWRILEQPHKYQWHKLPDGTNQRTPDSDASCFVHVPASRTFKAIIDHA